MDGGVREKQMADELKQTVKQKASERREKKWGQFSAVMEASTTTQTQQRQQQEPPSLSSSSSAAAATAAAADYPMSDGSSDGNNPSTSTSASTSTVPPSETPPSQAGTSSNTSSWSSPSPASMNIFAENRSEIEVNFTMIYLDYVVPFLFPFYRPCLFETSRGWMLVLLMKNRALFHTALSLANWLFAVLIESVEETHGECKQANWTELQAHQEISIRALQEDIRALNERGVANAFRECVSCMQSIIQLLEFEVAMANTASWQVHHDAAAVLFDQLITHHATPTDRDGAPTTPWASILDRVGFPYRSISLRNGKMILTSDQSAYLFYTAYLLWIDVVAATAKGEGPRLRKYHAELLEGDSPRICLGDYVGCHSWAVVEIAAAAELAAWKREQQSGGSLSMVDLVQRACAIETRVRQRMDALLPPPSPSSSHPAARRASDIYDPSAHHPVTPYSGFHETLSAGFEAHKTPAVDLHTRIWAQATVTYVNVIAWGLQPALPEIRASVRATMDLFRALPSPLALRTLVWPFAVTGCLALTDDERRFFAGLVDAMGAMHVFGAVKEALDIMRAVWEYKEGCCVEPQMWDMATCFSLLGHCSLLV